MKRCEAHPLLNLGDDATCPACDAVDKLAAEMVMERLAGDHLMLPVSPGELFDRYTILMLKSRKVADPEKAEQARRAAMEIRQYIYDGPDVTPIPDLDVLVIKLEECNEKLWDIEDQIRALDAQVFPLEQYGNMDCLPDHLESYVELARSVYVHNDLRSRLKACIDAQCGRTPEVKQYTEYNA